MQNDHLFISDHPKQALPELDFEGDHAFQVPEARRLLRQLNSAGRGLARSILHELCDFANSVKRGIHRANDIDGRIRKVRRDREDEWIRRGIYPQWPRF